MKKSITALAVAFFSASAFAAQASTYTCQPLKYSNVKSQVKLSVTDKEVTYKDADSDELCRAKFMNVVKGDAKLKYSVQNCGSDAYITISADMPKGGSKLQNGKIGGFVRIDNYEEGGYFPSTLICFANSL